MLGTVKNYLLFSHKNKTPPYPNRPTTISNKQLSTVNWERRTAVLLTKHSPLDTPLLWYNIYTMKFEFDPKKSNTNRQKHDIDFVEAQALWQDENRILYPARTVDEQRFILISSIDKKHWTAIYTMRNEAIGIISVRRSRKEEVALYEG